MSKSPQDRLQALIQKGGRVEEGTIAAIFDELPPVAPEFMLGEWKGGSFDTGHPTDNLLAKLDWAGKTFRSIDDVDPIVVYKDGDRVVREDYGSARVREVKFRGVVSAAMVYDKLPIIDSFRFVSDNMVLGAMDSKEGVEAGTYYFYLTNLRSTL